LFAGELAIFIARLVGIIAPTATLLVAIITVALALLATTTLSTLLATTAIALGLLTTLVAIIFMALATSFAGFFSAKFMSIATGMGSTSAFAGYFTLTIWVHTGKATVGDITVTTRLLLTLTALLLMLMLVALAVVIILTVLVVTTIVTLIIGLISHSTPTLVCLSF